MTAPLGTYFVDREQPPLSSQEAEVVRQFHDLYYRRWQAHGDTINLSWFGYQVWKCPLDLWVYQELLVRTRPDFVIETGTWSGGSALYLAMLCDQIGHGRVVTVDVEVQPNRPQHSRLSYLTGSSIDPAVISQVRETVGTQRAMVVLDSNHTESHVYDEMIAYSSLVQVGDYLVVEDTNVNGHPTYPDFGPGPMEAVNKFLSLNDEFVVDHTCERFLMTLNPKGYLKRIKPAVARVDIVAHRQTSMENTYGSDDRFFMEGSKANADNLPRELYLDLLIKTLTNMIYGDPSTNPEHVGPFQPAVRSEGRDWPAVAHTMAGLLRLQNLRELTQRVIDERIPGDFIETGIWRGGCCILMRGVLAANAVRDRKVYAADSFAGLPAPKPHLYPHDEGLNLHLFADLAVSLEQVKANVARYGLLDDQIIFVKGLFQDTLPTLDADRFALIRLDGDLYESTYVALEALYPKLAPGGFVIVDDYGAIPACQKAVVDYRTMMGIEAPINEIDWTGVWWQKPF